MDTHLAESKGVTEDRIEGRAIVIGGGIAGIQAALDLADARIPVTLVEKSPSLGGRMAQLDKTFPTMDCAI
ncbi:MAG: FAD-dependent oxidoreductase [bacterium]|nr:FAD-dependent oxidoreductase [bacterium]